MAYGFSQLELLRRSLLGQQLAMVAEVARRGSWKTDGAANLAGWVAAPTGMADQEARTISRLAVALERMPVLAAAVARGAFDLTQAALLANIIGAHANTDGNEDADGVEARFVADGEGRSVAQLKAWAAVVRPVTRLEADQAHEKRSLRIYFDERRGQYRISGCLDAHNKEPFRGEA